MYHAFWGILLSLCGAGLAAPFCRVASHVPQLPLARQPFFVLSVELLVVGIGLAVFGLWKRRDRKVPYSLWPALGSFGMLLVLFMWEIGTQQLGSRTFLKKEFIWSDIIITILLLVFVCGLVNGWRWVRFLVRWGSLPLPIWLWIAEISDKFTPPTEKFRIFAKPWMDSVLQMSLLTLWLIVGVFYLLGRTSAKAYFAPLPKGERRFGRFQFSMKSFLLFIAVLTIPLGPLSIYAQTYREQGNRTLNGLFSGVFRFGR